MDSSSVWMARTTNSILRRDNKSIWLYPFFALFFLLSLFLSLHHTPWRDEAQAWLMARDLSPWGLFLEARHDGHPILWHLCLKLIQAFGINYVGMMFLNWAFITIAIWLLFYRSTLPLLARIAFAFSPICLLQMSCNARNYAIAAALTFIAATLYRNAEKKPILFSVVLALLASTNVYAAAVFVGISFQFLLEQAWSCGRGTLSIRPIYTRYLIPNLILLAGALLLIAQLAPVPLAGEPIAGRPLLHNHIRNITPNLWMLFLVLPLLAFFSKSRGCPRILGGILAFALVLVPTILYGCHERHAFMVVLGVVYFLWIYLDDIILKNPQIETRILVRTTMLIVFVCVAAQPGQIRGTFKANWDSTHTAKAIIKNNLDQTNTLMVATEPDMTTSILMQLHNIRNDYGPSPYPPQPMSFADFFYTRMKRDQIPTLEDIKPLVLKLASANPSKTILVVSSDPENMNFNDHDPNYDLVPIYASPSHPEYHWFAEFYQVYVLKR